MESRQCDGWEKVTGVTGGGRVREAQQEGSGGLIPEDDGLRELQRGRPAAGHGEDKQVARKVTVACLK